MRLQLIPISLLMVSTLYAWGPIPRMDDSPLKSYDNYDFVAGDTVLFEDDFTKDQDGEFPSHWDLIAGQGVINNIQGSPAFLLTDGNYAKVKPLMKAKVYLGNEFTVEYDTYQSGYALMLFFVNNNRDLGNFTCTDIEVRLNFPEGKTLSAALPSVYQHGNYKKSWHHFALAYRDKQIKVYLDQYRVLTVPNSNMSPGSIQFGGIGSRDHPIAFRNVKIAAGAGMNMLNKVMTEGKFVTHGITFDIDKATLKPQSMGVINKVCEFLKQNQSLKLEIGGHTDSDGDDAYNMKLSEQRADAVRNQLMSMGIDAARLTAKGFGESKPISDNSTPEGKANNRRVEFTSLKQ